MKKGIVIIIVILTIIIAFVVASNKSTSINPDRESRSINTSDFQNKEIVTSTDKYISYAPNVLDQVADKRVFLYFYANWCPTCRPVNVEFEANEAEIPDEIAIVRVNYNDSDTDSEEKALAQKYGITYQHTFVEINLAGEEVQKWNGGGLKELIQRL